MDTRIINGLLMRYIDINDLAPSKVEEIAKRINNGNKAEQAANYANDIQFLIVLLNKKDEEINRLNRLLEEKQNQLEGFNPVTNKLEELLDVISKHNLMKFRGPSAE